MRSKPERPARPRSGASKTGGRGRGSRDAAPQGYFAASARPDRSQRRAQAAQAEAEGRAPARGRRDDASGPAAPRARRDENAGPAFERALHDDHAAASTRAPRDARSPRDARDSRGPARGPSAGYDRDTRAPRDSRDTRGPARGPSANYDRDSRAPRDSRDSRGPARGPSAGYDRDSRAPRDSRDTRPAAPRAGLRAPHPLARPNAPAALPSSARSASADGGSFEGVADWYAALMGEEGHWYQENVLGPVVMRRLGEVRGRAVVDLGCGEGYFCRQLAAAGAEVCGVDVSRSLIEHARAATPPPAAAGASRKPAATPSGATPSGATAAPPAIRYLVADAASVRELDSGTFDAAVINLAFQNFERPAAVLAECGRLLAPGGRLVFSLNHPCFRVPKASGWTPQRARFVESYLTPRSAEIEVMGGMARSYHQPLTQTMKQLRAAGFVVTDLDELASPKQSRPGPSAAAENHARAEIPLFLVLTALKR